MSEFISFTPEHRTTPERFIWDGIIRAFDLLSDVSDELDLFEELEALKEDDEEDALTKLFNYATIITTEIGQSSELGEVMRLLADNDLIDI